MGERVSIAILTPTRERPDDLRAMLDAISATAADPDAIRVYVGIDKDDPSYGAPLDVVCWTDVSTVVQTAPRAQLAEWTNRLADLALGDGYDILASFGDDHRPRTEGWDVAVSEAMQAKPGLVYTRDGLQDAALPTAPFWHADVIRALGFYFPPVLKHLWADNYWLALARGVGRVTYLDNVLIQHLHPSAPNGNPYDSVNVANDSHADEDRHNFFTYLKSAAYQADLERVRDVL